MKSAGTVSLIKLSAVLNVVHSIYLRKFSFKDNVRYRVWLYPGLRLERDRGSSREKKGKTWQKRARNKRESEREKGTELHTEGGKIEGRREGRDKNQVIIEASVLWEIIGNDLWIKKSGC